MSNIKPLEPKFYKTASGKMPVKEWMNGLLPEDAEVMEETIRAIALNPTIGLPHRRSIKGHKGLWEVRANLSNGIGRILCFTHQGDMVLLHGFNKKSQKTPKREIDTAKKRMRDFIP